MDKNDGTGIYQTLELSRTEALAYPQVPTRTGYYFTGWFKDSQTTTPFDFSSAVEDTTTIFAGWSKCSGSKSDGLALNGNYSSLQVASDGLNQTYYFKALTTGTYTLNYSSTASANVYFYPTDSALTAFPSNGTLNATSSFQNFSLETIKDKTYWLSFGPATSTPTTYPAIQFKLVGKNPASSLIISPSAKKIISVNFDESDYSLGVPDNRPNFTFVGWFTEENGQGTKLTDATGKALAPWKINSNSQAYAYFVAA